MNFPSGIRQLPYTKFTNAHDNFTQHLEDNAFFAVSIADEEFKEKYPSFAEQYCQTTRNFQWLINHALERNIRLRAVGSGWSLSKAAMSSGGIIDTKNLRLRATLGEAMVAESYLQEGNRADNLLFAQCGNTVVALNDILEKRSNPSKCLRASGGSNGQTIVGAFSTGTHGAAYKFGALSEFIVGMHLITGPGTHHWLERKSRPVTSEVFRDKLQMPLLADDEIFNAALVSFGSFGIIHSVLMEVEPVFYLEQESQRRPWNNALVKALGKGEFDELESSLPYPVESADHPLYHWEVVINPHDFDKGDVNKGVYVRTMYKFTERKDIPINPPGKFTYGNNLLGVMQTLLDSLQSLSGGLTNLLLVPTLVNSLFKTAYDRPPKAMGTIGETFASTIFRGKLFSAAFGLDRNSIIDVIDLVMEINKKTPFAGALAMRFVRGTKATLGFTHFEHTCVLELDGVDAQVNHDFLKKVADSLEEKGIPFTMHWGKINHVMNKERILKAYGEDAIKRWVACRASLLNPAVQEVFTNEFMEKMGLDEIIREVIT